jgi:hypothetical protein
MRQGYVDMIFKKKLIQFYLYILVFFNDCKNTQILWMSTGTYLAQSPTLWNNRLLVYKGKKNVFQRVDWKQHMQKTLLKRNGFMITLKVEIIGCVSTKLWNIFFHHLKEILTLQSLYFNNSSSPRIQLLGYSYLNNEISTSKFVYAIFLHKKNKNKSFNTLSWTTEENMGINTHVHSIKNIKYHW